jgi:hypothetical protein
MVGILEHDYGSNGKSRGIGHSGYAKRIAAQLGHSSSNRRSAAICFRDPRAKNGNDQLSLLNIFDPNLLFVNFLHFDLITSRQIKI